MKPIDFIPNPIIEDNYFISDNCLELGYLETCYGYKHEYNRYTDEKYNKFCKEHNLNKNERMSERWHEIYLQLCSVGIL